MVEPTGLGLLPDYTRPPVVETVLGVQFDRLSNLKNAHLGAFWETLDQHLWPLVSDAPPLVPQFERFDRRVGWAAVVQLHLTQDPSARVQIQNVSRDRMIQVQNGCLHLNWLRRRETDAYPRYEPVRDEFTAVVRRFEAFLNQRGIGELRPNQWEITYVNQIPQNTIWSSPADWSFFQPLAGLPEIAGLIQPESFNGEWHFAIPQRQGRLHISWQHGQADSNQEFIRLGLTARGPVAPESGVEEVLSGLDLGRQTIVHSFKQLMSDRANNYWGLEP